MSDEKKPTQGGVRRVGEKDRKTRLDPAGPLFPQGSPISASPPPSLPEDAQDAPAEPVVEQAVTEASPSSPDQPLEDDAAALLAELESEFADADDFEDGVAEDFDDDELEEDEADDTARFRPPSPAPYAAPARDRFPALPEEQAAYPQLKMPRVQPPPPPRKRGGLKFNLLAFVFALASCGLLAYFGFLWQNPYSQYNLFPPFTPPPIVVTETFTPSMTFTPSPTLTPSATSTPLPTNTPTLVPTETPVPEDALSAETLEASAAGFAFGIQGGREIYITNPEGRGACRWSSIAGTVSDVSGQALNDYQIRILGEGVDETIISGSASGYGPGGFELQLGNEALDAEFAVQLLDPTGSPVSDVLTVVTSSRCDWNISVLRFVQNPA